MNGNGDTCGCLQGAARGHWRWQAPRRRSCGPTSPPRTPGCTCGTPYGCTRRCRRIRCRSFPCQPLASCPSRSPAVHVLARPTWVFDSVKEQLLPRELPSHRCTRGWAHRPSCPDLFIGPAIQTISALALICTNFLGASLNVMHLTPQNRIFASVPAIASAFCGSLGHTSWFISFQSTV